MGAVQRSIGFLMGLFGVGVMLGGVMLLLEDGPLASGIALLIGGLVLLPMPRLKSGGARVTVFVLALVMAIGLPVLDAMDVHRQSWSAVYFLRQTAMELRAAAAPDGIWPADARIGMPDKLPGPGDGFKHDVMVADCAGRACVLVLSFTDERYKPQLKGRSFVVWTVDGGHSWSCGPGGLRPVAANDLPSTCRDHYPF